MSDNLNLIKNYLLELDLKIIDENEAEELVVVEDEENGINNLVIDCEQPLVVIEQIIMDVPKNTDGFYKRLLQMNRSLVHGAFVLDEDNKYVFFRDTLELENLDMNELEGTIQALSLALAEFGSELLEFAKK